LSLGQKSVAGYAGETATLAKSDNPTIPTTGNAQRRTPSPPYQVTPSPNDQKKLDPSKAQDWH
jgi:hypothetical protein